MFKLIDLILNLFSSLLVLYSLFGVTVLVFYVMFESIKNETYTEKFFLNFPWICKKFLASVDRNPAKNWNITTLANARRAAIKMNWVNYIERNVE